MTVWEVVMLPEKMIKDSTKELQNLTEPVLTCVLQACCKTWRGDDEWSSK